MFKRLRNAALAGVVATPFLFAHGLDRAMSKHKEGVETSEAAAAEALTDPNSCEPRFAEIIGDARRDIALDAFGDVSIQEIDALHTTIIRMYTLMAEYEQDLSHALHSANQIDQLNDVIESAVAQMNAIYEKGGCIRANTVKAPSDIPLPETSKTDHLVETLLLSKDGENISTRQLRNLASQVFDGVEELTAEHQRFRTNTDAFLVAINKLFYEQEA